MLHGHPCNGVPQNRGKRIDSYKETELERGLGGSASRYFSC